VFKLKQVWNLFANSGSLWVAWTHANVFNRKSFWVTADAARFSKAIRGMLQLKPLLSTFLKCEVGNGKVAAFWWDSWTTLGPLIDFIGPNGPRMLRLPLDARVCDAIRGTHWNLPNARSDSVQTLQILLTTMPLPSQDAGEDVFLWRKPSRSYAKTFSLSGTWDQLRVSTPQVSWSKCVWFKQGIPRATFIFWLVNLKRLPTKDRLLSWGLTVPAACMAASSAPHTKRHTNTFSSPVRLQTRCGNSSPPGWRVRVYHPTWPRFSTPWLLHLSPSQLIH